jgi:hypothetical protein
MISSTWRDEGLDEWEAALDQSDGRPWIAMLAGAGAILLVAIVAINLSPVEISTHSAAALAAATILAALVWGGAWFLTLHHATTGWKIGVAAVLWGIALLTVATAIAYADIALRIDAANVRRIRIDETGEPRLPAGMAAGPITRTMFDFLHDLTSERHQREAMFQVMGMDRLHDAYMVSNTPAMLKDCARFVRVEPKIDQSDRRVAAAIARVHERLGVIVRDEASRRELIKAFDKGLNSNLGNMRRSSELQRRQLEIGGRLCTFLATHRWKAVGSQFMFYNQGDLGTFDRTITDWNDAVREQTALAADARRKMTETGLLDSRSRF